MDSQDAHTKHGHDASFLPFLQVELVDLCRWQDQHPEIESDIDGRMREGHGRQVNALTRMSTIPSEPEIAERLALVQVDNDKCDAYNDIEDVRRP